MEQEEYIAKAMFRADQREQLRYAEDKGREEGREEGIAIGEAKTRELFALLDSGVSLADAKRKFGY